MEAKIIRIGDLKSYINSAFENDDELICLYDKTAEVKSLEDVCCNVFEKINSLIVPAELRGVEVDGAEVGYFVYTHQSLISFGLNIQYRTKEYLSEFWELIKRELGSTFTCALFDYNYRGINWLKKQGMNILFEKITILTYDEKQFNS